jgi:hypothetical protein
MAMADFKAEARAVAFVVCYSWCPPDDHMRHSAICLNQRFYELIFNQCRSADGLYVVLRDMALLKHNCPILIISNERLALLIRELMNLLTSGLSHPQLGEFRRVCNQAISDGCALTISRDLDRKLCDVEADLCTLDQIKSAIAEHAAVKSVDLSGMTVPPKIIAMVPESVARENVLIPIGEENGTLQIVMSNPLDFDTISKVQFILDTEIQLAVAPAAQIVAAIDRHYGQA